MKKWLWVAAGVAAAAGVVALWWNSRAACEEPAYRLVRADGSFEVRDYDAFVLVSTSLREPAGGQDGAFGRLLRYLQGDNDRRQKLAMTVPVFISNETNAPTMSFVLPRQAVTAGAPKPAAEDLQLHALPAGRYAAVQFEGSRAGPEPEAARALLSHWLSVQNVKPLAPALFAYYDPPWTPGFLRRNEVLFLIPAE